MSGNARYDVVVIGAGPSGSSAAFHLAELGYHVLLLEKDSFPREKVCGDGLTPRSLAALRDMGIGELSGLQRISGVRLYEHAEGSEQVSFFEPEGRFPGYGAVVPRYTLDHVLMKSAVERGAECWTEALALELRFGDDGRPVALRVRRQKEELEVEAAFFVISEGSVGRFGSAMRRKSLGRNDLEFAVRQYVRGLSGVEPFFDVHFPVTHEGSVVPGYGWVFPVSEDVVNVGAGYTYGVGYGDKIRIRTLYREFLETLRRHDARFRVPQEACSPLIGASLRVGLAPEDAAAPGLVATGDAAALVNPFNGEGIGYALESGRLAAEALHHAFSRGTAQALRYPEMLRDRYRRHQRLREDLPRIFGLVRLYEWQPPKLDKSSSGALFSPCFRHMLSDHEEAPRSELREILWEEVLDAPELRVPYDAVETRILDLIDEAAPMFGEMGFYTRQGLLGVPGYLCTLVLLASGLRGKPAEGEGVAVAGELLMMSQLFHGDVAITAAEQDDDDFDSYTALAILVGDVVIAMIFEVLNGLGRDAAVPLSDAILRHSAGRLLRQLDSGPATGALGASSADRNSIASLSREFLEIVAIGRGYEPALREALSTYGLRLGRAVQTLHDVWVDAQGHELRRRSEPLYLLRQRYIGQHLVEARRRGCDVQPAIDLARAGELTPEKSLETLRGLAASGALEASLAHAAVEADAAAAALVGLPRELDTSGLRLLARNVGRAIDHARARTRPFSAAAVSRPGGDAGARP